MLLIGSPGGAGGCIRGRAETDVGPASRLLLRRVHGGRRSLPPLRAGSATMMAAIDGFQALARMRVEVKGRLLPAGRCSVVCSSRGALQEAVLSRAGENGGSSFAEKSTTGGLLDGQELAVVAPATEPLEPSESSTSTYIVETLDIDVGDNGRDEEVFFSRGPDDANNGELGITTFEESTSLAEQSNEHMNAQMALEVLTDPNNKQIDESTLIQAIEALPQKDGGFAELHTVMDRAVDLNNATDVVLSLFFDACRDNHQMSILENCYKSWLAKGVQYGADSLHSIIKAAVNSNHIGLAASVIRTAFSHQLPIDTSGCNIFLEGCSSTDRATDAWDVFWWMREVGNQCKPNSDTYRHLISSIRKNNSHDDLPVLFKEYLADDLEMNSEVYYAFMGECHTAGNVEVADEVLELYKKTGERFTCKMLNLYCKAYATAGHVFPKDVHELIKIYEDNDEPPDEYTFSLLLTAAHRSNQNISKVDYLVQEVYKRGIEVNAIIAATAILAYKNCKLDPPQERCKKAYDIFNKVEKKTKACYHILMTIHVENMDLATAMRIQRNMELDGYESDCETYSRLYKGSKESCLWGYAAKYKKLRDDLSEQEDSKGQKRASHTKSKENGNL